MARKAVKHHQQGQNRLITPTNPITSDSINHPFKKKKNWCALWGEQDDGAFTTILPAAFPLCVSSIFIFIFLCLRAGLEVLGFDCVMVTAQLLQWLLYVAAMSKHILNQLNEEYMSTSRSLSLTSGCKWSLDARWRWLRCEVMHFFFKNHFSCLIVQHHFKCYLLLLL